MDEASVADAPPSAAALTWITMEAARAFLAARTGVPPELAEGLILRWLHLNRLRWTYSDAIEFVPRDGAMVALDQLSTRGKHVLDTLWQDGQRLHYSWQNPSCTMVAIHDVKQVEGRSEPRIYLAARLFVNGITVAQEDMEKLADRRQGELELALSPDQKGLTIILLRRLFPPAGVVPPAVKISGKNGVHEQVAEQWPAECQRHGVKLGCPSSDSVGRYATELRNRHRESVRNAKSVVAASDPPSNPTPR